MQGSITRRRSMLPRIIALNLTASILVGLSFGAVRAAERSDAPIVQLEATLKPDRVQPGAVVSVCMRLYTESTQPLRFWTTGAAADYDIAVLNEQTKAPAAGRPSWHVTISRVAHFEISRGHDDVACLPLTQMFDLTLPALYQVNVTRSHLRPHNGSDDESIAIAAPPVQLRVEMPGGTSP